jgi:predicted RecB family endonuclease
MTAHSLLQRMILDYLNALPDTFAFPTHSAKDRPVHPGVSDIIAVRKGRMVAVEVKVGRDKPSMEQVAFKTAVVRGGGKYIEARAVEEIVKYVLTDGGGRDRVYEEGRLYRLPTA